MHDEIDGRLWAAHGRALGESLSHLLSELNVSLRRLNEIQFEAPWRLPARRQKS